MTNYTIDYFCSFLHIATIVQNDFLFQVEAEDTTRITISHTVQPSG